MNVATNQQIYVSLLLLKALLVAVGIQVLLPYICVLTLLVGAVPIILVRLKIATDLTEIGQTVLAERGTPREYRIVRRPSYMNLA
jgi:hypothetical protein